VNAALAKRRNADAAHYRSHCGLLLSSGIHGEGEASLKICFSPTPNITAFQVAVILSKAVGQTKDIYIPRESWNALPDDMKAQFEITSDNDDEEPRSTPLNWPFKRRLCPNCKLPIGKNEVYRAGYEIDDNRTIPPTLGRGAYCDHIVRP